MFSESRVHVHAGDSNSRPPQELGVPPNSLLARHASLKLARHASLD